MKKNALLLGIAFMVLEAASVFATPAPPFTECPAVGQDTSCGLLIVFNAGGSASIFADSSQGAFNPNGDDTLIGAVNSSGSTVASTTITGTDVVNALPAFFFDGGGLCGFGIFPQPCSPANPFDPTGYGGPGISFTNMSSDLTTGTVVFNNGNGLADGQSAYFSLEGILTASDVTA
ncbi:MAG: hypothetical protein ACRD2G_12735, partial [Terriglobia bacterium]